MSADMLAGEIPKVVLDPAQGLLYCDPHVDIMKSAEYVNLCTYPANTFSNSQFTVNVQVPSQSMLVGRKISLAMEANFTFGRNTALKAGDLSAVLPYIGITGGPIYNAKFSGGFGMRANPLSSVCSNIQCQINNQNVNVEANRIINALLLTFDDETRKSLSGQGCNPDNTYEYQQGLGANNNPLGDGSGVYEQCRGNFQYTVVSNSETTAVLNVKWYEYVMLSPLLWSKISDNSKFLVGINQLNFIFTLTNLSYMFSMDYLGNTLSPAPNSTGPITYTIEESMARKPVITGVTLLRPTMLLNFTTPDLDHFGPLPNTISYNYNEMVDYTTDLTDVVPNTFIKNVAGAGPTLGQITSNNIQLGTVPRYLMIYIGKNIGQRSQYNQTVASNSGGNSVYYGPALTDTYLYIDNVNIQWNGKSSLLASANGFSLYEMSKRNGVNVKWIDWYQNGQCVVLIDLGKDLCTPLSVGSACQANFSVTLNYINNSPAEVQSGTSGNINVTSNNYAWTVNVVTIMERQLKITPNGTTIAGSYPPDQFFGALVNGQVAKYQIDFDAYDRHIIGGSFWSNLRDKIRNVASKVHEYLPQVQHGFNQYVAPFLSERNAEGINNLIGLADRWLPHLIASGVDKQTILRTFQPHIPLQRLEQIYDDHIRQGGNSVGGNSVGGRKVAKSRLRKF